MQHQDEAQVRPAERIARILDRLRIPLLIFLAILAAGFVGYFIYSEVAENQLERMTKRLENADELYLEWLFEQDAATKTRLESDLMARLTDLADANQKYPGQRALFLQGQLYMEKEDYPAALEVFRRLSGFAQQSYLGLEGVFNTAVLLEEAGQSEEALGEYRRLVSEFPQSVHVPHARFSVGRILEGQGKFNEALTEYVALRSNHPESSWTNFAVNRIIWLKSTGKVEAE